MEGILSKGITFSIGENVIEGLQSIPSLGGKPDKIDITTLADDAYHYMNGLKDYGDLDFNFLLAPDYSNYEKVKEAEGSNSTIKVKVGTKTFTFSANVYASLDAAEVNQPLKFTVSCGLTSDISVA